MRNNSFFDKPTEQSLVKARIVEKYFWAWAKVIIPWAKRRNNKIGYVDLFAGQGSYNDGTKSTPILVLEKAAEEEDIRNMLISVFNDVNSDYAQSLQDAIDANLTIGNLKKKPIVRSMEVGDEIAKIFEFMKAVPTLFFVDPWGYKGLSLQLINSAVKNWGCDCIFFFNYNSINRGIDNPYVVEHMNALFGKEQAEELRIRLQNMRPFERELTIVETISQSLKKEAGQYVLPFCFKFASGNRSSHHLIFVSKNIKGYQIMKEIMAKESSESEQGVPSFEYNPAPDRQSLLFGYALPLDDLADMLLADFAGRTITMKQIYNQHNVGTPYIEKNYKDILTNLEIEGKIQTDPPASKRPKRKGNVTFGPNVKVTFPTKEEPQNGD